MIEKHMKSIFATLLAFVILFISCLWWLAQINTVSYRPHFAKELNGNNHQNQRFFYLIQTEGCLPEYLMSTTIFGQQSMNDVLVLTFESLCKKEHSRPSYNIEYIYKPNTTWSEGRNILYERAINSSKDYIYYVFMDGDLTFHFTSSKFERVFSKNQSSPLKTFERLLLEYEPAIGVPWFCIKWGQNHYPLCWRPYKYPFREVLPVSIHFDAACNAFHKNAIKFLLPYRLKYENSSWHNSQKFLVIAADLIFRGQILHILPVTTTNAKHRNYPRNNWDNWAHLYGILLKEIPPQYRKVNKWLPNENLVKFTPIIRNETVYTPYMRVKIPKHRIHIEPYRYFKS
ncbi:uncharacterized protein LOC124458262 [Xenia sp. Carnegie-2017]|uniref:uncharacterized protein LOC124458262 n=1 Tax=Xenia sp. Carnegie-2017 TaxID=2897299 RepID=UPI001F0372C6|nr:uncharacterized protein LOC124458262 [Xenia sp. Carnegie-2017]